MKIVILLLVLLSGCATLFEKEMKARYDMTCVGVSYEQRLDRCENEEVICYTSKDTFSCKYKKQKKVSLWDEYFNSSSCKYVCEEL